MRVISNKREVVAIFTGKCFLLREMLLDDNIDDQCKEDVLDSMFEQSLMILGEQ